MEQTDSKELRLWERDTVNHGDLARREPGINTLSSFTSLLPVSWKEYFPSAKTNPESEGKRTHLRLSRAGRVEEGWIGSLGLNYYIENK